MFAEKPTAAMSGSRYTTPVGIAPIIIYYHTIVVLEDDGDDADGDIMSSPIGEYFEPFPSTPRAL